MVEVAPDAQNFTIGIQGRRWKTLPNWKAIAITRLQKARVPKEAAQAEIGRRVLIVKGKHEVGQVGYIEGYTRTSYAKIVYPSVEGKPIRVRKAPSSIIMLGDDVEVTEDALGRVWIQSAEEVRWDQENCMPSVKETISNS